MNKQTFLVSLMTLGVISAGMFGWFTVQQNDLDIKAFEVCGKNANRTFEENGKKSVETDKVFYKKCLNDIGHQSAIE